MPRLADAVISFLKSSKSKTEANNKQVFTIGNLVSFLSFGYFENEGNSQIINEKIIRRIYKLMSFNQTTPAELFKRKVDMQEYGAALQIAR